jgi:hypothetical protein
MYGFGGECQLDSEVEERELSATLDVPARMSKQKMDMLRLVRVVIGKEYAVPDLFRV